MSRNAIKREILRVNEMLHMMLAELPDKIERYRFLDISGMHRKEQGRTLKREHKRSVWIPLVLTLISVGTFCGAMIGGSDGLYRIRTVIYAWKRKLDFAEDSESRRHFIACNCGGENRK